MKKIVLGVDVGGTSTKLGLVDREGNLLAESKFMSTEYEFIDGFIESFEKHVDQLVKSIGPDHEMIGIGIGAPNANFYRGTIEYPPNLKWPGITPLASMVKRKFKLPTLLTNDANAAAYGEMIYGGAKGMKDFVVITLGTGLGSGIVSNGQLVYGYAGNAGEVGHTLVNVHGRHCGCGKQGCLETYVSATGIRRTVYKLLADYTVDSKMREVSFEDLSAEMITDAAHAGDEIAIAAFEYTARILGMKLSDVVAHSGPEAIFLFGGLTHAKDLLFMPTAKHFNNNLMPIFKGKVKLMPSELNNKNAAILGSAAMIWKHYEDGDLSTLS
ncbi:ROK family protein [Penaeicola halotolerans]|uniref:ROK family protein n=1 Tax=Penaeicola halotolerans TaxID=2793196 RepID=UPI001CF84BCE|nr:ROK family protein [Penaeicola halotolerans]